MKKSALLALAVTSAVIFSLAAPQESSADDACVRKEFQTSLVKFACAKGGQPEAVKTMKKFIVSAKEKVPEVKDCKSCHSSLKPDFKLTPNALDLFKKAGGK
ncbi:hypothetical protein WME97_48530 [Sorangium sp. So ce367]|uniref:hypothetical protein n=1 Tax=Sorangium sp. So ce367 TaxID=3133305 RepID=UPI003F5DF9F9